MNAAIVSVFWIAFFVFSVIAGWNYISRLVLYVGRVLSLANKLEFDWWAMWGFRTGFLGILFFVFVIEALRLFLGGLSGWADVLNLVLMSFLIAYLFGLVVGHLAMMINKIRDKDFFRKEFRKTRLSRSTKGRKKEAVIRAEAASFPSTVKYFFQAGREGTRRRSGEKNGNFSVIKIVVFGIMGSIIVFWILHVIILG